MATQAENLRSTATRVLQDLVGQLQSGLPIAVCHVEDLKACVCFDDQQYLWMVAFEEEPPISAGSARDLQTACSDAARMVAGILSRSPSAGMGSAA